MVTYPAPSNAESKGKDPFDLSDEEVNRIFRALADATRRDIVRRTLTNEATVSELAADYNMSFAAVQKHVTVLETAGLVTKHAQGRERYVRGNPETIHKAQALLDEFEKIWRGRISRLDALLAEEDPQSPPTTPPTIDPSTGSPTKG